MCSAFPEVTKELRLRARFVSNTSIAVSKLPQAKGSLLLLSCFSNLMLFWELVELLEGCPGLSLTGDMNTCSASLLPCPPSPDPPSPPPTPSQPPFRKPQHEQRKEQEPKRPHIKKPLNAFMLYMKEMRANVVAECTLKESAAINQILGRRVSSGVDVNVYGDLGTVSLKVIIECVCIITSHLGK